MSTTELYDDNAKIPDDRTRQQESSIDLGVLPRRFSRLWGGTILMAFTIGAGLFGLTRFAFHVSTQEHKLAPAEGSGLGIIVRSQLIDAWLPPAIIEIAKLQSQSPALRTHEDLRQLLTARGLGGLWFAVKIRAYRVDHEVIDMVFLRRPCTEPDHFPQFLEILAAAAAADSPEHEGDDDFPAPSIHVLPERLAKLELRDILAELQKDPDALVNR
jgi:hypothetical protein